MTTTADEYVEKLLKSSATFLQRWKDANAVMRELTISHKTLRILLTRSDQSGNLLLSCLDPVKLSGPVQWDNSDISVSSVRVSPEADAGFLLRDERAGVELLCGGLEIRENVKL